MTNCCIGPVENCNLYTQSWEGVKVTWYAFMNDWNLEMLLHVVSALPGVRTYLVVQGASRSCEKLGIEGTHPQGQV